ncbi:hypothetical protein [Acinetobacter colistiniresistens]|uniref:hypothetical protein n=1 Tax=Acinetobacter colistiniresistens TaxID=280145 RepID=UPI00124FAE10|nr:hypothetical protein [Acinetobacter colistiniresistens]
MNNFKHKLNIILLSMISIFASHSIFAAPATTSKVQNLSTQNLGVSVDQFKVNFNKLASQIGAPQIKTIKLENEDKGKSFAIQMPSHLAIIGNTDNKGMLTRLSVGLNVSEIPQNELGNHSMMLGGFAITAIKSVDNNKTDNKRDDAIQDVYEALWKDKKTFTSPNTKNKVYKNYKLAAYSNPKMGVIMIGVEPNKK